MPAVRHIELHEPWGGVVQGFSYQKQPPYTTPDALNVLPTDSLGGRRRIGSRPGVEKHHSTQFGSGNPVRVLARLVDLFGRPILFNMAGGVGYYETTAGTWFSGVSFSGMNATGRVCTAVMGNTLYMAQAGLTQPYYFDGSTGGGGGFGNTPTEALTLGDVPQYCSIVACCYNRLIFAGDTGGTGAPRTVYASRVATPKDHDIAETDDDAAYSEPILPQGNENDALTAIVPWYGDYCLYFFKSSTVLQFGDRGNGDGQYYTTGIKIGCLDAMSWCRGSDNTIYFMSKEGLAAISPANPRGEPKLLSQEKLPDDLLQLDPAHYEISLAWDVRLGGIRIAVTKTTGGGLTGQWFYDVDKEAFWPIQVDGPCDPFCFCYYPELTMTHNSLLYGTRNGYIRRDNPEIENDDGTNFESYCYFGPLHLGSGLDDGLFSRASFALARVETDLTTEDGTLLTTEDDVQLTTEGTGTGGANWKLYVGDSPEQAYNSEAVYTAALDGGRNYHDNPRRRGVAAYVKLYGTAGSRWAFESAQAELLPGGPYR